MKTLLFSLVFMFVGTSFLGAQNTKARKTVEKVGDLYEVTIYYENDSIMQHGFITEANKLHASWESYYKNGDKKCIAFYDQGKRVGTWFYWYPNTKTKVEYSDNKIVSVEEIPLGKKENP